MRTILIAPINKRIPIGTIPSKQVDLIATVPELPPWIKAPQLKERQINLALINLWICREQLSPITQNILRVRVAAERIKLYSKLLHFLIQ